MPEKLPDFCQMIKETEVIADRDLDRLILTCELMNWVTGKGPARFEAIQARRPDALQLSGALPGELTGCRRRDRALPWHGPRCPPWE